MIVITDERCTGYGSPGHPERPERISRTVEFLRGQSDITVSWEKPATVDPEAVARAHTSRHLHRLGKAEEDFDGDTPAHTGIQQHALRSVGGALGALATARASGTAFSLLRPPGHHATRDRAMGFCYLNSMAIAALEALATGVRRVAVFDFDVHHGNGTEAILAGHPGVWFASVHQHPCYPGTGTADVADNCFNYPVRPRLPRDEYLKVLERAMDRLTAQRPEVIGVSAGFDAYAHDPIAQETLEAEDFYALGRRLRGLGLPIFSILEGGYSEALPGLVLAYLKGLEGR